MFDVMVIFDLALLVVALAIFYLFKTRESAVFYTLMIVDFMFCRLVDLADYFFGFYIGPPFFLILSAIWLHVGMTSHCAGGKRTLTLLVAAGSGYNLLTWYGEFTGVIDFPYSLYSVVMGVICVLALWVGLDSRRDRSWDGHDCNNAAGLISAPLRVLMFRY